MTIGEDRAAEVFKHLSTREVQQLSTAMAGIKQISNKQLTDVLAEFEQEAEQFAALSVNANEYLRSVLIKALGEERASSLLEDILETRETTSGIETLNFMEPQSAADIIRDEHPQIIATILVHLKRGQAADILALFDERLRHDVMLRIATFGGVQPAALAELTEVLNGLLDGQNLKRSKMGGVRTAAEIINLMKTQQEEAVITAVREFDGELAQKIIDEMFLFENLVEVDDRSIQRLLQEVDSESLLIALKGSEPPLREKFLRNMSQRAADILRDDLANRGPVRLSQVENEQKAILLIVRRLAETGEMVIGSGDDTYVWYHAVESLAAWRSLAADGGGVYSPHPRRTRRRAGGYFCRAAATAAAGSAADPGPWTGVSGRAAWRPRRRSTTGLSGRAGAGARTGSGTGQTGSGPYPCPNAAAGERISAHPGYPRQRDRLTSDADGAGSSATDCRPDAGGR